MKIIYLIALAIAIPLSAWDLSEAGEVELAPFPSQQEIPQTFPTPKKDIMIQRTTQTSQAEVAQVFGREAISSMGRVEGTPDRGSSNERRRRVEQGATRRF